MMENEVGNGHYFQEERLSNNTVNSPLRLCCYIQGSVEKRMYSHREHN